MHAEEALIVGLMGTKSVGSWQMLTWRHVKLAEQPDAGHIGLN